MDPVAKAERNILKSFSHSFAPLRISNFRLYISGQLISLIGTWLQMTAQALVVYRISHHSSTALGVVTMLSTLPMLLLGPVTGPLLERVNRRRLLIFTQVGAMLGAFLVGALIYTGVIQLWHIYTIAFVLGTLNALDIPAQQVFIGDLSGMEHVRSAMGLNAMIVQTSRMLGPSLAGFLLAWTSESVAFFLNGASFIAVIASLYMVRIDGAPAHKSHRSPQKGSFAEGVAFLRKDFHLKNLLMAIFLMSFFGMSLFTIIPAFMRGDARGTGLVMGSSGMGALVSLLILLPIAQTSKKIGRVLILGLAWVGVGYIGLSFCGGQRHLAMAVMFFCGLGAQLIIANTLGLVQVLAPAHMRARVIGLFTIVVFGLQPISSFFIGRTADLLTPDVTIRISGCVIGLGAVVMALNRSFFNWELHGRAPEPRALGH